MQFLWPHYVILAMNRYVILICATVLSLLPTSLNAQTFTLQGRVTDEKMSPIELVTVSVLSQGKVALTSLKGEFNLTLHSDDSVVVKFSMIGYKTKTRVLRNPRGKQTLQVVLHEGDNTLGEVSITEMRRQTGQTQELKKKNNLHLGTPKLTRC